MIIKTSINSLISNNIMRQLDTGIRTTLERLSSGLKINHAADDPSGMAIAKGMTGQIRGYDTAVANCQDGVNLFQTMDGGLGVLHSKLLRMRDLAVKASNDAVFTDKDMERMDNEFQTLLAEVDREANALTFNTKKILTGKTPDEGVFQIWIMDQNGANPRKLFSMEGNCVEPKWSPDGRYIAFVNDKSGNYDIYVYDMLAGGAPAQVNAADGRNHTEPSWSSDGSQLTWTTYNVIPDEIDIYTKSMAGWPPGGAETNITNTPGGIDEDQAVFTFDNSQMIYENWGTNPPDLYLTDVVPPGPQFPGTNLTNTGAAVNEQSPAAHPTQTLVAYESNQFGSFDIWTMDYTVPGSQQRLTTSPALDGYPTWAPNGTQILFETDRDGDREIYIMNDDGTGQQNLTNYADSSDHFPHMDPSGSGRIVFHSDRRIEDEHVLQVGPNNNEYNRIEIEVPDARKEALELPMDASIGSASNARAAIDSISNAISKVSDLRNYVGYMQNRVQHIIDENMAAFTNLAASRSRIEDADMAAEIQSFTKNQIMLNSSVAAASQINTNPEGVLNLMRYLKS